MAKRNRSITESKIEKWISDGRGQGHGKDYKPWLTIRDVASDGTCTRVLGWKTDRVHHLLSQLETDYFYNLEWSDVVTDIREQYPLSIENTLEIAERLGIEHPKDPKTQENIVMTTDFFIDYKDNGQTFLKARTIKSSNDLNRPRVIEKFEIERTYWLEKGIDWAIVTEKEILKGLTENVKFVHNATNLDFYPQITPLVLNQLEPLLYKAITSSSSPLAQTMLEVDSDTGMEPGTSLTLFRHFIAVRKWTVDMETMIDTGKPISVRKGISTGSMEGAL